jgi:hypothetical protein
VSGVRIGHRRLLQRRADHVATDTVDK